MALHPLLEARVKALKTQQQLADEAGVDVTVIISTELGRSIPRLLTQEKLAQALGIEDRRELFPEPEEATA